LLAVSTDFEKLTTKNINWTYEFNNMTCPVNYIMKQAKDEMMQKLGFYNIINWTSHIIELICPINIFSS
jgi:hypothetical protein